MKGTTASLTAIVLLSLAGCRAHRTVEQAAVTETVAVAHDSLAQWHTANAYERGTEETVEVEYFPSDSSGRQNVRRIVHRRRLSARTTADTTATTVASASATKGVSSSSSMQTATSPATGRRAVAAAIATALTLILLTILIRRKP